MAKASTEKTAKAFKFDYSSILDETAKRFALTVETYDGNKSDQTISSGLLCTDLILGNCGWVPGWHTSLGFEQSAKTTTATMTMVEAVKANVPMVQIWDFERSFDARYAVNMSNNDGTLVKESFGRRNPDGSWKVKPRVPSYIVDTAEEFFDALHHTLKRLPKKQKIGEKWYLIFPNDKRGKAAVGNRFDQKLKRTMDVLAVEVPDGRPQGFILLDSYPTMNPAMLDEDEGSKRMAAVASMFSEQMKRVKSLLGSRKVVLLGINQLRLKPGPSFGNPEYEPCGEALKLNSEVRIKHRAMAPQSIHKVYGTKDGWNMIEKSATNEGGTDTYKYIKLEVEKNKVGGSPKGTNIYQRVWVSDAAGDAHGLDPVYDAFQFMQLTGMIAGNMKKFNWKPSFLDGVNIKAMNFHQLKVLILGTDEDKKRLCKKLGIAVNPKILENCRAMLSSGKAYELFKATGGEVEDADEEEDDDDEDDDE